ncbi:hypothetical protein GCM10009576_038250 [Streptomyces rhizosphaericus]|uniref:Uncharacterized protein n=1 Tax=Streptomyces rhizosphaericus TaxID=114699 RepID=A0ABN1SA45_9ACTN
MGWSGEATEMAEGGLPGELRALGRGPGIPPSGGPSRRGVSQAGGVEPEDGAPPGASEGGVPPGGGETLVERVLARIVGLPVPVADDDRIREEQWWRPRAALEAGQGPAPGVSRSADRAPGRPPSARTPRP